MNEKLSELTEKQLREALQKRIAQLEIRIDSMQHNKGLEFEERQRQTGILQHKLLCAHMRLRLLDGLILPQLNTTTFSNNTP